jgi:glycosyltransferase involved in cell wall biosynthesis
VTVHFAGYQALSILHGGPRTQITETMRHVQTRGIVARPFDPWTPFTPAAGDVFHLFAANIGTYHLAREVHALGLPLIVSPITYSTHSAAFVRRVLRISRLAQKGGAGIWTDYALCADILSWADHVLPNTHAEGILIAEGYGVPEHQITIVPNGVDGRFATADPALFHKTYGLKDVILNVGHIGHTRKNVLTLIRALATIDHPAVIIGRIIKSPYGDACVREAARHKHILLIDGLSNDEELLASAYAASRVFVLPSLFETPGIAALEAGLAGANVTITKYGGTQEYFGAMADYVDPYSVESVRAGILAALERPRSAVLREHIRKHYLWQTIAEQTAKVYARYLPGS